MTQNKRGVCFQGCALHFFFNYSFKILLVYFIGGGEGRASLEQTLR